MGIIGGFKADKRLLFKFESCLMSLLLLLRCCCFVHHFLVVVLLIHICRQYLLISILTVLLIYTKIIVYFCQLTKLELKLKYLFKSIYMIIQIYLLTQQYLYYDRRREMFLFSEMCNTRVM